MIDRTALVARLLVKEGLRLFPYTDTTGHITIGVGRNLSSEGISRDEAMLLLDNDLDSKATELTTRLPLYARLDGVRQAVLLEVAFNLGVDGLLGFHKMLDCLSGRNFSGAADELLASKAATQTGTRYQELATMMRTGVL